MHVVSLSMHERGSPTPDHFNGVPTREQHLMASILGLPKAIKRHMGEVGGDDPDASPFDRVKKPI